MAHRQRNIPVTSKEEVEVQTDVKLLEGHLEEESRREDFLNAGRLNIHLSDVFSSSGLLRPFSDQYLLRQFTTSLKELREGDWDKVTAGKRLQLLERQIEGLLKRDLLLGGQEECHGYYDTLNQKEKEVIRLEGEQAHYQLKINRLRKRVDFLETQVEQLRSTMVLSHKALEENKLYVELLANITNIVKTNKNKVKELEKAIEEKVVPAIAEFEFNLQSISRTINQSVHTSFRSVSLLFAKELDKQIKDNQFTEQRLSESINSLYTQFKGLKGLDYLRSQFEATLRTETAEQNYKEVLTLFKHELDVLKKDNPNLKGVSRLDSLIQNLDREGIELFECKGWININRPDVRYVQVGMEDKGLKDMIALIAGQFKRAYLTFPELKKHISASVISLFEGELLEQLISSGSIERLKEVVVNHSHIVKVDNFYTYDNSQDKLALFHLRVVIKALLEEMERMKTSHGINFSLDEGILELIRCQILEGIDVEAILGLFRPLPKIVEVPYFLEKPVYGIVSLEKGVPIRSEAPLVLREKKCQMVEAMRQVPVYIDRVVENVIRQQVTVTLSSQKAVPVEVQRDVVVDRIVQCSIQVPVIREKHVALREREEVIKEIEVERFVDRIEVVQVEKVVAFCNTQYLQVQKIIEKPVYLYETRQIIKQVQVKVPIIIRQTEFVEVDRAVPYIIERKEVVNIEKEIAVQIKVPELIYVDVVEYRQKPIVVHEYIETIKQIEVIHEKEILKEIPKEIFIERSHFIKGDQVEVLREVQVFVDKPIIKEILTSKDVQIEKIVPLYITEQIPIITEISVPFITEKVRELQVERIRLVPVREQVVKPVEIQKPVPVIIEKAVIRTQIQFIQKIVEKIVEVPRIVQIQRIVQKIVVVPRIIEKIVEVPKIIEKIVIVEVPVLQIVEIPVPYIVIQEVERPIEIIIEKRIIEYVKDVEIAERERVVERVIERDREVIVEVERRIPYQVVREVPVQTYRDRIEYQKVEIYQTKVQTIEVQVPFHIQEAIRVIEQKIVPIERRVEQHIYEKLYCEKDKIVVTEVERLVIQQVIVEKAVISQYAVEVPGPQTYLQNKVQVVSFVPQEKIVREQIRIDCPKEVYLETEKIVHEIQERVVEVPVNRVVFEPKMIEVAKTIPLTHYKEVAVEVPVLQERLNRDIIQQLKEVQVVSEKPVEVQICRQKIKQIYNEVQRFLVEQSVREIQVPVQVRSASEYIEVQVPTEPIIQQLIHHQRSINVDTKVVERIVERIVMMPQIVEVVKHIHHISEKQSLGVAVDVDINIQTAKFAGVSVDLRKALQDLLVIFKANVGRQPDLKNLIAIIEKQLLVVDQWSNFPKLVEVPKIVEKIVQVEKIVLVPTCDRERESVLGYLVQKLLAELYRLRDSHKITLSLDEQLLRLFFSERKLQVGLDLKVSELLQELKLKHSGLGAWAQSNPFLIGAFLQEHLILKSLVKDANLATRAQETEAELLRSHVLATNNKYNNLLCFNRKMYSDNMELIQFFQQYKDSIDEEQFKDKIRVLREFYSEVSHSHTLNLHIQQISTTVRHSTVVRHSLETEGQDFGVLLGKISKYETKEIELDDKVKEYQNEITNLGEELRIRNSTIAKLQAEFDVKMSRVRDEMAKNPNLNKDIFEENRKLQEKSRAIEKQLETEKRNSERLKKQQERNAEKIKKDAERELERKEKEIKDNVDKIKKQSDRTSERELAKLKNEIERIKKEKEKSDNDLEESKKYLNQEIKTLRERQTGGSNDKQNDLIRETVELRKRLERNEQDYEKLKKAASDNNGINEREVSKLRLQIERLNNERKDLEKGKKSGFMDLPQQSLIINKNINLEKKVKTLESEIESYKSREEKAEKEIKSFRDKAKKLEIELETKQRELQLHVKSRMQSTTYQSGLKGDMGTEGSVLKSPRGGTGYKSGFDHKYMSPAQSSVQSREDREGEESSSSRVSRASEEGTFVSAYRSKMTLKEFMETKHMDEKERDMYVTYVMIKIIEKIEEEAEGGMFNSYSPSNIHLNDFNTKNLDKLTIKFGAPIINRKNSNDGLYLAPEVLAGEVATKKSSVFCLGIILDELIHGDVFFKRIEDITNLNNEFKVRGQKLNPILKNTLFEMMSKDVVKRLEMSEAKRRLSLQKYITSESRGQVTTTRVSRPRGEE